MRSNPILAHEINEDHSLIAERLTINFLLKTLRLVVVIFNLSFFVGLYWYLFCEISMDL